MKCNTPYCRNKTRRNRPICPKCRSRKYKDEHPFKYHYNALRNNARRRGHEFDLSFEDYKAKWMEHPEKWATKLVPGNECHWEMDRKDPRLGYTKNNVQIIEKRMNVLKYHHYDKFILEIDWQETHKPAENEAPF